jgi:hypothetical protein
MQARCQSAPIRHSYRNTLHGVYFAVLLPKMSSQKQTYVNENLQFNCLVLLYLQQNNTESYRKTEPAPFTDTRKLICTASLRTKKLTYSELPTLQTYQAIFRLTVQLVCPGHGLPIFPIGTENILCGCVIERNMLDGLLLKHKKKPGHLQL